MAQSHDYIHGQASAVASTIKNYDIIVAIKYEEV